MELKEPIIINVPAIQKEIHEKHQKFVKDFGSAAEKVMADHKLFADIVMAKLYRIALIYKEEAVIDEVKITEDGPYRKISLCKSGNVTYVDIRTNGIVIVLEGFTYTTGFDTDFHWPTEKFVNVNNDEFNWVDFSRKLLDYIHATIYERKEAMEARLDGMFQPSPFPNDEIPRRNQSKGHSN